MSETFVEKETYSLRVQDARVITRPESQPLLRKDIKARAVAVDQLNPLQTERMYFLFSKYYANHDRAQFLSDLFEKDHVILLVDSKDKSIQGFSTILKVDLKKYGMKGTGFYSGDTVLEKEYWGTRALGTCFLSYLWKEKIKSPFRPVYWFLISKGYKTYLLMVNNFRFSYPRPEKETPADLKILMDKFYGDRFKNLYSAKDGVIRFDEESCCLKDDVAQVTKELMKNQRIAFFAKKNPGWNLGHELCCLAEMTVWMPLKYVLKKTIIQNLRRKRKF